MGKHYEVVPEAQSETIDGVSKRKWAVKDISSGEIVASRDTWEEAQAEVDEWYEKEQRQEQEQLTEQRKQKRRNEEEQEAREKRLAETFDLKM